MPLPPADAYIANPCVELSDSIGEGSIALRRCSQCVRERTRDEMSEPVKRSAYEAYRAYCALHAHFSREKYDFFTNGIKVTPETFSKRPDKGFFEKLAKQHPYDLRDFIVANILEGRTFVIDLTEPEATDTYRQFMARREALSYRFKEELSKLFAKGAKQPFQGEWPELLTLYQQGKVSIETMVILNDFVKFVSKFDERVGLDNPVWYSIRLRILKYRPFLTYDRGKMKAILKERIEACM